MTSLLRISIVGLALLAPSTSSYAGGASTSGQACAPNTSGSIRADKQHGAQNWSSATKNLVCPLRLEGETLAGSTRDFTWARAYVSDRNGSLSVQCRVEARTRSGAFYLSSTKYSGGSYKGTVALTWSSNPVNAGNPFGPVATVHMSCYVPKATSSGRSAVEGVAIGY